MKISHITPKWNIEDFKSLAYSKSCYRDKELINHYISAGHTPESLTLYNYFEPNWMPECVDNYIRPTFSFLDKLSVAVNLFKIGQFIPQHADRYDRYREVNNVSNIHNIVRYIIMLEDGLPGQIIEINNQLFTLWKAGDCYSWQGETPHAFYNFSDTDRYALQLTGVKS